MMQAKYEQQSEHIKTITLTKTDGEARCGHDVMVKFDMIKRVPITELTTEDRQYMSIIRGDAYEACSSTDIKEICFISEWSDYAFDECLEMIEDYIYDENNKSNDMEWINERYFLNPETIAVFFVVGTDYPFAWQHIGTAASNGYMTADQLVCLENNLVMVKTAFKNYRIMCRQNTCLNYGEVMNLCDNLVKETKETEQMVEQAEEEFADLDSPIERATMKYPTPKEILDDALASRKEYKASINVDTDTSDIGVDMTDVSSDEE